MTNEVLEPTTITLAELIAEERRLHEIWEDAQVDLRHAKRRGEDIDDLVRAESAACSAWVVPYRQIKVAIAAEIEAKLGIDPATVRRFI